MKARSATTRATTAILRLTTPTAVRTDLPLATAVTGGNVATKFATYKAQP